MILGFNQNVYHNGTLYHVQTEDGGLNNPVITTVVFKGGTTVASRRTPYADIIRSDGLDAVVREIMREQHASIISELKAGLFSAGAKPVE